jgi:RecA-family ATPase
MEQIKLAEILTTEDPDPAYIVDGLLYQGQMVVVAGEPGVGKSFLQYTLAMSVAAKLNFLGLPTKAGKVLYFDEENARPDLQQYLRQIWRGLGQPSIPELEKALFIEHFALSGQSNRFQYMAEVASRIQPSLIIIDTVTPVCAIKDENDNAEASRSMRALRRVKEVAGPECAMILLKHSRFTHDPNDRQTIRGAKDWLGSSDAVWYHKVAVGKPRTDGLRNCRIFPDKVRAFGLRDEIHVIPHWVGSGAQKGVVLNPRP